MSRVTFLPQADVASARFPGSLDQRGRNLIGRHTAKLKRRWAGLVHEYLVGRAIRELRLFDDRMLKDIGITRSEIESIVRRGR